MPAAIDWGNIAQLLYVAPLAGLAVAISFSVLILGVARAGDAQRAGAPRSAAAYSVLALVATIAFAAVVVFSVEIIITK
jgi:hypothetical protein